MRPRTRSLIWEKESYGLKAARVGVPERSRWVKRVANRAHDHEPRKNARVGGKEDVREDTGRKKRRVR